MPWHQGSRRGVSCHPAASQGSHLSPTPVSDDVVSGSSPSLFSQRPKYKTYSTVRRSRKQRQGLVNYPKPNLIQTSFFVIFFYQESGHRDDARSSSTDTGNGLNRIWKVLSVVVWVWIDPGSVVVWVRSVTHGFLLLRTPPPLFLPLLFIMKR